MSRDINLYILNKAFQEIWSKFKKSEISKPSQNCEVLSLCQIKDVVKVLGRLIVGELRNG